jgi:hypothetical protein
MPPDIATMRATAQLTLGPDDAPGYPLAPAGEELDTLTATLRGHLELIAPEVERAAKRLRRESIPRYCALACVGEARGKLQAGPKPSPHGPVTYARKLARVLNALCDHHENLREGR